MYGYVGKIIRINLKDKTIKKEPLDLEKAKKYVGGRGLGTKMLMEEIDPKINPLDPENKLMIVTGPLTGTPVPTGGRYMVITKSPLTGAVACSNSGGKWGAELKFAGYDAVIIEEKAEKPVYISIEDDKIEIRDASHIWGKEVTPTTEILSKECADRSRIMTIGPAGERLSFMAAIMNDIDRAAGRSGVGAVMGSKNLKAITVRGTSKVKVFDEEKVKRINLEKIKTIRKNPVTGQGLPNYGTGVLVNILNDNGAHPVKNFQLSYSDKANTISGETMSEKYFTRKNPCYRCPIACGRMVKIDEMDKEVAGPEYETLWCFGTDCGIYDMIPSIKANNICNELGMDTISVGSTISAAMELYQRGYIKDEELKEDGLTLKWGDGDSVVEWTRKIGYREGFGAKMSDGSYRLCDSYGVPEYSMTVKKQELSAYDPRGIEGQGLSYATNNRGGCHVRGYMVSAEILGIPEKLDRFKTEAKEGYTKGFQDLTAIIDSLGLCLFTSFALKAEDYVDLYNSVCGTEHTVDSIIKYGERIWNLEKIFNLKAGIDKSEDALPKRLVKEPVVEGPSKGHVNHLKEMLPKYYSVRGWDKDGVPTRDKLHELELEEYIAK